MAVVFLIVGMVFGALAVALYARPRLHGLREQIERERTGAEERVALVQPLNATVTSVTRIKPTDATRLIDGTPRFRFTAASSTELRAPSATTRIPMHAFGVKDRPFSRRTSKSTAQSPPLDTAVRPAQTRTRRLHRHSTK